MPTPEPAKIPMRWPKPMVKKESMARTWVGKILSMGGRVRAGTGAASHGILIPNGKGGPSSIGVPVASSTRPINSGQTFTER